MLPLTPLPSTPAMPRAGPRRSLLAEEYAFAGKWGTPGSQPGQLAWCTDLVYSAGGAGGGTVFIADYGNRRVQVRAAMRRIEAVQ